MTQENYNVTGKERIKGKLAILLLEFMTIVIVIALVGSFILIGFNRLEVDKAVTLVLAVSTIFSGLLGSAITYYFSAK